MTDKEFFMKQCNDNGDGHTIGQFINAVFQISNEHDAARFYRGHVEWLNGREDLNQSPETVAKANIGWCYGEGMAAERQEMWSRTTGAAHPVFGRSIPTPEEAFEIGRGLGLVGR